MQLLLKKKKTKILLGADDLPDIYRPVEKAGVGTGNVPLISCVKKGGEITYIWFCLCLKIF